MHASMYRYGCSLSLICFAFVLLVDGVDELYLAHVVSTRAHAHLVDVDATEALAMNGVVDFVSHKDVSAKNNYALLYSLDNEDETVFAKDTVGFIYRNLP